MRKVRILSQHHVYLAMCGAGLVVLIIGTATGSRNLAAGGLVFSGIMLAVMVWRYPTDYGDGPS